MMNSNSYGVIVAQVIWQSPQLAPVAVGLAAVVAAAVAIAAAAGTSPRQRQ